jgi:hypothetical protein
MAPADPSNLDAANAFGAGTSSAGPSVPVGAVPGAGRAPRGPRSERWIPLTLVVLALLGTGLGLWRAERRALADPVQQGERGEVTGVDGRSLLTTEHLGRAFALVQARLEADEVVTDVDLTPVRVRVAVRDGIGHARSFSVDLAYDVRTQDDGRSTADGPALAQLDAAAPERFVRTVLERSGHPATALENLGWRYDASGEVKQAWTLRLQDVPIPDQNWVANGDGRGVRRPGDPAPSVSAIPEPESEPPTTASTPSTPARPKRPKRPKRPTTSISGFETNAVQITVGDTRIITDPASARRLKRCLRRAQGRRSAVRACVNAL